MKFKSKIYLDYDDVLSMCINLEREVSKMKPDLIVGITRGGLLPALHLSHALGVKMTTVAWQTRDELNQEHSEHVQSFIDNGSTVVFVDDINDTGTTFHGIDNMYKGGKFVSLVEKCDSSFKGDFASLKLDDERWLVFPWEKD